MCVKEREREREREKERERDRQTDRMSDNDRERRCVERLKLATFFLFIIHS